MTSRGTLFGPDVLPRPITSRGAVGATDGGRGRVMTREHSGRLRLLSQSAAPDWDENSRPHETCIEGNGDTSTKTDPADDWLPVDAEVLGAGEGSDRGTAACPKNQREQRVQAFFDKIDSDLRIQRQMEQAKILQDMQASVRARDP